MKCNLVKIPYEYTDAKGLKRTSFNLALVFENDDVVRISHVHNEFKNSNGDTIVFDTKKDLVAHSSIVKDSVLEYEKIK